ncbi:hypothetical protein B0H14DRAFT_2581658 [Mycena olivaceomarginata]|nr:hypothetical protein B0H14DRAFT_2581658 [Mycena olivaceomarginata]
MRFTASLVAAAVLSALQVTADFLTFDGDSCTGAEGGDAPCDNSCIDFSNRHSFKITSSSGHNLILFENTDCTGVEFNFGFESPGNCINVNTGTPIGSFRYS